MTDLTNLIKNDLNKGETTPEVHLSGGLIYRYLHGRETERIAIYRRAPETASVSEANTFIRHTYGGNLKPPCFGRYGWLMNDPVAFTRPIKCRGGRYLWKLPDLVLEQVRGAYMAATAASEEL